MQRDLIPSPNYFSSVLYATPSALLFTPHLACLPYIATSLNKIGNETSHQKIIGLDIKKIKKTIFFA
jgi:hypothetical protein